MTPTPITRSRTLGTPKLQKKLIPAIMQPPGVDRMRSAGTPQFIEGRIYVPPAILFYGVELGYQDRDNFVRNMVTLKW